MTRLTSFALALACIVAPVVSILGAAHCQLIADAVYECDEHHVDVYCEATAEYPLTAAWFRR